MKKTIASDAAFLRLHKLIDYSLLLGIETTPYNDHDNI